MKKVTILLFSLFLVLNLNAQKEKDKDAPTVYAIDSTKVFTLDKTIKTLYESISGEKGIERNWGEFKLLFKPGAKLIPSGKDKKGLYQVKYMSPNDYIKSSGKWLKENGFFEKEIHRTVSSFGNIKHVFSTYEAFHSESDKHPFMRGINSIQLLNDGNRWWIINIYWTQETFENPIPKIYLPK
ncbi:MAG: hypothetical protein ABJL44_20075 [Algibacter sp.]